MLKTAEKNVLYVLIGTALIGLTGIKLSYSSDVMNKFKPKIQKTRSDFERGVKKHAKNKLAKLPCKTVGSK